MGDRDGLYTQYKLCAVYDWPAIKPNGVASI